MPVIWPGFSWHNLYNDSSFNQIERQGGNFYWRQVYNTISSGAKMIYVAMFDEVDEGTAMFKLVAESDQLPVDATLVSLDVDGYKLPSDWYLQLGGETGSMLRGEIPLSQQMPIELAAPAGTNSIPTPSEPEQPSTLPQTTESPSGVDWRILGPVIGIAVFLSVFLPIRLRKRKAG